VGLNRTLDSGWYCVRLYRTVDSEWFCVAVPYSSVESG